MPLGAHGRRPPRASGARAARLRRSFVTGLALLAACSGSSGPPPAVPPPREPTHVVFEADYGLFSVPIAGGAIVTLGDDVLPSRYAAMAGDRVLLHQYPNWDFPDVWSVRIDGTGRTPLAATGNTERLIGVVGDRALIDVHDDILPSSIVKTVLSVPVSGGPAANLGLGLNPEAPTYGWLVDGQAFLFNTSGLLAVGPDGLTSTLLVSGGSVTAARDGWAALNMADGTAGVVRLDGSGLSRFTNALDNPATGGFGFAPLPNPFIAWGELVFTAHAADTPVPGQATGTLLAWTLGTLPGLTEPRPLASRIGAGFSAWDVDGSRLVVSSGAAADGTAQYARVDVLDGMVTGLGPLGGGCAYAGRGADAAAFLCPGPGATWDLVAARLDGGGAAMLAADVKQGLLMDSSWPGPDPVSKAVAWSGGRFVFRQAVAGVSELRSVRPDGTGLVTISRGAGEKVAWAISGSTVVYGRASAGQSDLYAVEADGADHRVLAETAADETFGIMAGRMVVYVRTTGAVRDLLAVPLVGGAATQLTAGMALTSAVAVH